MLKVNCVAGWVWCRVPEGLTLQSQRLRFRLSHLSESSIPRVWVWSLETFVLTLHIQTWCPFYLGSSLFLFPSCNLTAEAAANPVVLIVGDVWGSLTWYPLSPGHRHSGVLCVFLKGQGKVQCLLAEKGGGGRRKSERWVKELIWFIDLSFWVTAHDKSPDLTESSSSVLKLFLVLFGVVLWFGFFLFFVFLNQFVILMMVTVSIASNSTKSRSKQGLEDQDFELSLLCSL